MKSLARSGTGKRCDTDSMQSPQDSQQVMWKTNLLKGMNSISHLLILPTFVSHPALGDTQKLAYKLKDIWHPCLNCVKHLQKVLPY